MAAGKPLPQEAATSADPSSSIGPEALKAFTHPLRMAMYAELQRLGAATASQLARELGESSGQTSYHLRQLQRHGFVEDDPDHEGGRERWWRPVGFQLTDPGLLRDPATMRLANTVLKQVIAERAADLTSWAEALDPDENIGLLSSATLELTDDEAESLTNELTAVLRRASDKAKARTESVATRRFRVHADVFPLEAQEHQGASGTA
jgi:DNA-binding transcriptional ArsR family regulator